MPQEAFLAVLNLDDGAQADERRPPPLRPPAVLRAPVRLLRLRHRHRPRRAQHGSYVDALLAELELERQLLAPEVETVFLGGGTPTFTEPDALARLLAALPPAARRPSRRIPRRSRPTLAALLREHGVNRVSLGAQSFQPHLLETLERRARPEHVRDARAHLRDAGFDNVSLDLIYGIPGQSAADLERDLAEAFALEPEHLSCYELEAKPGTRFTHAHGAELDRRRRRWRTTSSASSTRSPARATAGTRPRTSAGSDGGRDLRARHNLAYWLGRDYLGIGIGAVSTVARAALAEHAEPASLPGSRSAAASAPQRELEPLAADVRRVSA